MHQAKTTITQKKLQNELRRKTVQHGLLLTLTI